MSGFRKAEIETVKSFISQTDDKYRSAYAANVQSHPRQCIMIGTTNADEGFLRDTTGNRRFLPIKCSNKNTKYSWDLSRYEIDQLYAEAKVRYAQGEKLYLEGEALIAARIEQRDALEEDHRSGVVNSFLDTPIPKEWDELASYQKINFLSGMQSIDMQAKQKIFRNSISCIEVFCECFGRDKAEYGNKQAREMNFMLNQIPGWKKQPKSKLIGSYGRQRYFAREEEIKYVSVQNKDAKVHKEL